ncbi:MAG: hypothetical protein A2015_00815 [Spirochaetes bacterium GWF1_31_7]|nr:MAG: hypothetical protein A2Y30_12680 [Spirochaetes bacterium GWE1_32_154]OHD51663.1 MAG: hypothetical protein A2Y29_04480 [Spirochaetes bacterium GWE2_31_10]OHD51916.1 MAG: hypothetical protein A2015_00815 [Spirochaetes bacterium GWF1_31_7]HBD93794.1 hypothetical protein [Spirochaetia bacterium]
MANKQIFGNISAGIIGGGLFLFFLLFLDLSIVPSIIAGAAGYAGGALAFGGKKKELEFIAEGVTQEKLDEILKQGNLKVKVLKDLEAKITNKVVTQKIEGIIEVVEKIFDDLKKDPKDVKTARQFLIYYLDATINILERYHSICSTNISSIEIKKSLDNVESLLDTIKDGFEKQLIKLLNDDILDLDTEIKLLDQTMKSEGLK